MLNLRKNLSMLRTTARYFDSFGFSALLVLFMCPVISSESDLMDSLRAPSALALRRPRSRPSYSATLFVHPLKSSLAAYFKCVPDGAMRIAEAPAHLSGMPRRIQAAILILTSVSLVKANLESSLQ